MIVTDFTITPDSVPCPWAPGATATVYFAVDKEINSDSLDMQATAVFADWWAARTSETVAAQNAIGSNVTLFHYDVAPGAGISASSVGLANFRYVQFEFTVPLDTIFPGGCDDLPVTIELSDSGAPLASATVTLAEPALIDINVTITPQCIDCDNPEDIVVTFTVTNTGGTTEIPEVRIYSEGGALSGGLWASAAGDFGVVSQGGWFVSGDPEHSFWDVGELLPSGVATTVFTFPAEEMAGSLFCSEDVSTEFMAQVVDWPPPVYFTFGEICVPPLIANDDLATTPAATPVAIDVLANDTLNGDPVAIGDLAGPPTVVAAPSSGTAVWNPATNSFDYTPVPGFCGTDTFEYEIEEATFTFVAGLGQLRVAAPEGSIVDWGDGSPLETTGAGNGLLQHAYATAGPHVGTVEQQPGAFSRYIEGAALLEVVSWGAVPLLGGFSFFASTSSPNLTAVPSTAPPGATNMTSMFQQSSVFNQDISGWDVGNVANMAYMFNGATSFNQPIGGWDVSNVANMANMFYGAVSFNQPIGGWDVGNVTDMSSMFRSSAFNQDISGWDVGNVADMSSMFRSTVFNQDISGWDVGNVTNMTSMFQQSTVFNQDISGWDTSSVISTADMFFGSSFNQDISGWDVSNVTNMSSMFRSAVFNQDIGGWDVGNVTDMTYMFNGAASFNQDLSSWCVENIASAPFAFDLNTPAWTLPKPNWGAPC